MVRRLRRMAAQAKAKRRLERAIEREAPYFDAWTTNGRKMCVQTMHRIWLRGAWTRTEAHDLFWLKIQLGASCGHDRARRWFAEMARAFEFWRGDLFYRMQPIETSWDLANQRYRYLPAVWRRGPDGSLVRV
jgi:hypothetical protein